MPEREPLSGMIVTVGGQSEQIAFSLGQHQPTHVAYLATNTPQSIGEVDRLAAGYPLPATRQQVFKVEDDAREIGHLVEHCLAACHWLQGQGVPLEQVTVDATGGRKWMSAGAVLVASHLGLSMPYVHAEYRDGRPDPDTMCIVPLGDVYELINLPELRAGIARFNACDYAGAVAIFGQIRAGDLVMRGLSQALLGLARLCDQLDRFEQFRRDLSGDFAAVARALRAAARSRDYLRELSAVAERLEALAGRFSGPWDRRPCREIAGCLITAARRRERRGQYDGAILLYYRTLELASQVWLAENWKINTSAPEWDRLPPAVVQRFRSLHSQAEQISLVNGYVLLYLLGDENVTDLVREKPGGPRPDFEGKLAVRNYMVCEHGFDPVSEHEANKFSKYAVPMAERLLDKSEEEIGKEYGLPELCEIAPRLEG